jgi:hypothetical protein
MTLWPQTNRDDYREALEPQRARRIAEKRFPLGIPCILCGVVFVLPSPEGFFKCPDEDDVRPPEIREGLEPQRARRIAEKRFPLGVPCILCGVVFVPPGDQRWMNSH